MRVAANTEWHRGHPSSAIYHNGLLRLKPPTTSHTYTWPNNKKSETSKPIIDFQFVLCV